jgi:putative hydrolase
MSTAEARSVADARDLLRTDHHSHTTHSDGRDPLSTMIAAAWGRGLTTLYVTDHVRADTTYLPEYVVAVRRAQDRTSLRLVCGVEAKIMDTTGRIDLPPDLGGIDHVAIADHQFPLPEGPTRPDEIRARLAEGRLTRGAALASLLEATTCAVRQVPGPRTAHLAHLFSVLPKAGLDEGEVPEELLAELADACRATDTAVEVNEKWRCPSAATVAFLHSRGVRIVVGSDAHRNEDVGAFHHVPGILAEAGMVALADETIPGRP